MNIKYQLEESRRSEETYKIHMEEKQCLEAEIAVQRKEAKNRDNILTDHLKEILEDFNKLEE
jgi:hypothetical protein